MLFGKQIAMVGAFGAFIGGSMFFQAKDLEENYVKVNATIKEVTVDCYIENSRSEIVDKESGDLAYFECAMAPYLAEEHGYSERDIHKRAQIVYSYLSPIDQNYYSGDFTRRGDVDDYVKGAKIQIFSHKETPEKSRTPAGNPFLAGENV